MKDKEFRKVKLVTSLMCRLRYALQDKCIICHARIMDSIQDRIREGLDSGLCGNLETNIWRHLRKHVD
jgi:hypothetical protein